MCSTGSISGVTKYMCGIIKTYFFENSRETGQTTKQRNSDRSKPRLYTNIWNSAVVAFPQSVSCGEGPSCRIWDSAFAASPHSVSGREGTPEELIIRSHGASHSGLHFIASPLSVSGRESEPTFYLFLWPSPSDTASCRRPQRWCGGTPLSCGLVSSVT